MDWEIVAPMITGIVFILTTGGVLVLRPIAKRLGALLEVMARERAALPPEEIRLLRETMETVNQRMALLEERQDFTERLLGRGEAEQAPSSRKAGAETPGSLRVEGS